MNYVHFIQLLHFTFLFESLKQNDGFEAFSLHCRGQYFATNLREAMFLQLDTVLSGSDPTVHEFVSLKNAKN